MNINLNVLNIIEWGISLFSLFFSQILQKMPIWVSWVFGIFALLVLLGAFFRLSKLPKSLVLQRLDSVYRGAENKNYNQIAAELEPLIQSSHPHITKDKILVELLKSKIREDSVESNDLLYAIGMYYGKDNDRRDLPDSVGRPEPSAEFKKTGFKYNNNQAAADLNESHLSTLLRKHDLENLKMTKEELSAWLCKDGKYLL